MIFAMTQSNWWKRLQVLAIYYGVLLATLAGIPFAKQVYNGSVGPRTYYFATAVAAPAAFALLALFHSRRLFWVHLVLALFAGFAVWVGYPALPPMGFERQIVVQATPVLFVLYLAGALSWRRLAAISPSARSASAATSGSDSARP